MKEILSVSSLSRGRPGGGWGERHPIIRYPIPTLTLPLKGREEKQTRSASGNCKHESLAGESGQRRLMRWVTLR